MIIFVKMKTVKTLFILIALLAFSSCEQEGTPVTLDELYSGSGVSRAKFFANIGGKVFETENAKGLFLNDALAINAEVDNRSAVLAIGGLGVGSYMGADSPLKNYINYVDESGTLFTSNKQGEENEVIINVVTYNEQENTISGQFTGTLFAANSDSKIRIKSGQFTGVQVEIPYFGEMMATTGNENFHSNTCIYTSSASGGFIFETIVSSANNDTLMLSFTLEENIQEKDYFFDSDPITGRYNSNTFSTNAFKHLYTSESGKLTITQVDTVNEQIKGNFNFDAKNFQNETVLIRNGSFTAIIR